MLVFFDTSAFEKVYINEPGTLRIQSYESETSYKKI